MPITASNPFKWRHHPGDIIMWCVRWYLRYPISVAQMAEITKERGLSISSSCIWRWVQIYGPELDKRCRRHLKPTNKSWRVDETYIKVKGQERFLYRAVDSSGQTIDFLLTAKRDTAAAKRFFQRGLANPGNVMPRVINVDKNRAYPAAVNALKKDGTIRPRCRVRQCKYLNNVVVSVAVREQPLLGATWRAPAPTAFPSLEIIAERSSPSRVRCAAPNNGAPLTAPGRS